MTKLTFVKRVWIAKQYEKGIPASELAMAQRINRRCVYQILERYKEFGFDGLKDKAMTGAPPKLNAEQKIKLENVLDNPGEFRAGYNSVEVLSKIKNIFGTDYTLRHVRRLLKSLDYSRIKPRPTHINKDTIKAKDTVKKLKKNSAVWIKNGSHLQEMSSA